MESLQSDPLRPRPHGLAFEELKDLSEYLDRILDYADASLAYYRDPDKGGFAHLVNPEDGIRKTSKASTATCLGYLSAAGEINGEGWDDKRKRLRNFLIDDRWTSAELEVDNPFTSSFLLEAIHALGAMEGLTPKRVATVKAKIKMLNAKLVEAEGALSIDEYPATAFLTFKVVRALVLWSELTEAARDAVKLWIWGHLYQESMLIASDSPDADYLELAYALLTASRTSPLNHMTPRERRVLRHAVDQFFSGQRDDGTWPRSRPLFRYPGIGNAYAYDYELLVSLLTDPQLNKFVEPHLGCLRKAAWALDPRQVPLVRRSADKDDKTPAFGWSSEHHGGKFQAESWPTASVFHYCFELQRLISHAVRRDVFDYVDAPYDEPLPEAPDSVPLEDILDSNVEYDGQVKSFKDLLKANFLEPLIAERDAVRDGRAFGEKTKVSAILYGPPGTSKTRLSKMIAKALGWPLLSLDPSHLTRRGLDAVHAEADALFGRLKRCDQVVVLLDEIDELVREREASGEITSRFLTTAMLPKIADLHSRRKLVYLVATNHVENFDPAISRPGRFDVIVPVMPPTAEEKLAYKDDRPGGRDFTPLRKGRDLLDTAESPMTTGEFDAILTDLTFDEAEELSDKLKHADDAATVADFVERAASRATLNQVVRDGTGALQTAATERKAARAPIAKAGKGSAGGKGQGVVPETWKLRISGQQKKIRGLGL